MSLVRLLTSGKSLVGLSDSSTRYRMANPASMPTFQASKNPFRTRASAPTPKVETVNAEEKMRDVSTSRPAEPSTGFKPQQPRDPFPAAKSSSLSRVLDLLRAKAAAGWRLFLQAIRRSSGLAVLWCRGLWFRGPAAWWTRIAVRRHQKAATRFATPAVQSELSLDHVTVKRNDLSDADLEVALAGATKAPPGSGEDKLKLELQQS